MNDQDKDYAIRTAQEIAKYAFTLAFFYCYPNADAEVKHCKANLSRAVKELLEMQIRN